MKRIVIILLSVVFVFSCKAVDENKINAKSEVVDESKVESSDSVINKLPFEITALEGSWADVDGYFYVPEVSFYVKNISNDTFSSYPIDVLFKVRFMDDNGVMKGSIVYGDAYGLPPGMIKGPIRMRSGSEITFIEPPEFRRLTAGLKTFWSYNFYVKGFEFEAKGRLNVPK